MEEVDKEIGTLLDNYIKKLEESKSNSQEQSIENQHLDNDFNRLGENVIIPVMNKYYTVFRDRGFGAVIIREGVTFPDEPPRQSIVFSFNQKKSPNSEFMPPVLPALKFVEENKKIAIYENKFDASGLGCCTKEGVYEIHQITEPFVNGKLSDFFKSFFNTD